MGIQKIRMFGVLVAASMATASAQLHGPGDFPWDPPNNAFQRACAAVGSIGYEFGRMLPYERLVMDNVTMQMQWVAELTPAQLFSWNARIERVESSLNQATSEMNRVWDDLTPPLRPLCESYSQEFFQQLYRDCFLSAFRQALVEAAERVAPMGPSLGRRVAEAELGRRLVGVVPNTGSTMHAQLRGLHWNGLQKINSRFAEGEMSRRARDGYRSRLHAAFQGAFQSLDRGLQGLTAETCNTGATTFHAVQATDLFDVNPESVLFTPARRGGNPSFNRIARCGSEDSDRIATAYWARLYEDPAFPHRLPSNEMHRAELQADWITALVAGGLRLAESLAVEAVVGAVPATQQGATIIPASELVRRRALREAARQAAADGSRRTAGRRVAQFATPVEGMRRTLPQASSVAAFRRPSGDSHQLLGEMTGVNGQVAYVVSSGENRVCQIPRSDFCGAVARAENRSANDSLCRTPVR